MEDISNPWGSCAYVLYPVALLNSMLMSSHRWDIPPSSLRVIPRSGRKKKEELKQCISIIKECIRSEMDEDVKQKLAQIGINLNYLLL
jgi:hypothetical protein